MATAKTGTFYLTGVVTLPAANPSGSAGRVTSEIDLSAYVNVPTGQAIAIREVDFIYQTGTDMGSDVVTMLAGNGAVTSQLTDLNAGGQFVRADDQSLVASGSLNIDQGNCIASHASDLYPDNFGPATLSEAFICVNDTLYLTAGTDNSAVGATVLNITVRVRAQVVKLSTKDWMSVANQSTASDN